MLFVLGTEKQRNNTHLGKNSENTLWQLDNMSSAEVQMIKDQ